MAGERPRNSDPRPSPPRPRKIATLTTAPRLGIHLDTFSFTVPTPTVIQVRATAIPACTQMFFVPRNIVSKVAAKTMYTDGIQ